jgi:hypothetical protein
MTLLTQREVAEACAYLKEPLSECGSAGLVRSSFAWVTQSAIANRTSTLMSQPEWLAQHLRRRCDDNPDP